MLKLGYNFFKGEQIIVISQSLVKQFIHKGNAIQYCPKQVKLNSIDKKYDETTKPMDLGNYFESFAIGGTSKNEIKELNRLRNGKKSVDQKRIDFQVQQFKKDAEFYSIEINRKTVQIPVVKVIPKNALIPNVTIILRGILDIMSYIYFMNYHKAVIDLKLTKDVNTTKGNYCWGSPNEMDHLQAYMYNYITGLPFYYMVYDYKPKFLEKKFLPIYIQKSHTAEMLESVRKTAVEIIHNEYTMWKPEPGIIEQTGFFRSVNKCSKCPVSECEFYNNKNFIINS